MAVDNVSQEKTIDDIQAELNSQLEEIRNQAEEDAKKRELMAAAVKDALRTPKPVTSPVTDKDDDLIMIDTNPISHQNAEASGSGTNNPLISLPKTIPSLRQSRQKSRKPKPGLSSTDLNVTDYTHLLPPSPQKTSLKSENLFSTYMTSFIH